MKPSCKLKYENILVLNKEALHLLGVVCKVSLYMDWKEPSLIIEQEKKLSMGYRLRIDRDKGKPIGTIIIPKEYNLFKILNNWKDGNNCLTVVKFGEGIKILSSKN